AYAMTPEPRGKEGDGAMFTFRGSLLLVAICSVGLTVAAYADPGIPDTVYIGGGPLVVGQSLPITLSITNDEAIQTWSLGFLLTSQDGGFAQFDSAVYVGRMSDPSVISVRIAKYCDCEPSPGVSPDILISGGIDYGLNALPSGRGALINFYFTGLDTGSFFVDSTYFPPAGRFMLVSDGLA